LFLLTPICHICVRTPIYNTLIGFCLFISISRFSAGASGFPADHIANRGRCKGMFRQSPRHGYPGGPVRKAALTNKFVMRGGKPICPPGRGMIRGANAPRAASCAERRFTYNSMQGAHPGKPGAAKLQGPCRENSNEAAGEPASCQIQEIYSICNQQSMGNHARAKLRGPPRAAVLRQRSQPGRRSSLPPAARLFEGRAACREAKPVHRLAGT